MAKKDAPISSEPLASPDIPLEPLSAEVSREKLAHLHRLASLGTFSASMVHEIRNALVSGKTYLQLLVEKHGPDEFSHVVMSEFLRIDSLLNQMLRFSASDRPAFNHVYIHELLERSLRLVMPQLREKSVQLQKGFQAEQDLIPGDENELGQVFVNLFLNAIEAMGGGGTLSVSTHVAAVPCESLPDTAWLEIEIQDSGMGIAPENLARLFEPFFTTKITGTGLGLYITRRIIEHHHGSLQVRSKLREGTTFAVRLPFLATNA